MKTQIYMVRHAESNFVIGEERTRSITGQGHEAVRQVTSIMHDVQVDAVVSSSYLRAVQTVQGIADERRLEVITYEDLRERPIKGLDYEMPKEERLAGIKQSFSDKDFAFPGGESTRQAAERAIPVLRELLEQYRGKTIVLGTHGNIMTIILNHYDSKYDFTFWESITMPDLYRMDFDGDELVEVERLWN